MLDGAKESIVQHVRKLSSAALDNLIYRLAVDRAIDALRPMKYRLKPKFKKLPQEVEISRVLSQLIVEPFRRKTFPAQRWNSIAFRCFYSALEKETAIEEVKHYARKHILKESPVSHVHYVQFSTHFRGKVVDIHKLATDFPELVDDAHHPTCHVVAEAVFRRKVDALLAPSVRRKGGKCLAVYKKRALKVGEFEESISFFRDGSGSIAIERSPYKDRF